jgi:hypothetical protein
MLMTRMRRRTSIRRTSIPRVTKGYNGLLAKLNIASAALTKARRRR